MYFFYLAIILFFYMLFWYVVSLAANRNDVADIAWSLGFILMSWVSFGLGPVDSVFKLAVNLLVTFWAIRLTMHLFRRMAGNPEDPRYAKWRKEWGRAIYLRSFLQVFMLQGVCLYIIALPILLINHSGQSSYIALDIIGFIIWASGFIIEAFSDWQLLEFKKNPSNQGKILQDGLWLYSRHPNYFGQVLLWWGLAIIAIAAPYGWIGFASPILITLLILFVSGIPIIEKRYENHLEYQEYKKRTSIFIPLPPKGSRSPPSEEEEK